MALQRESTVDPFADPRSAVSNPGYDTDLLHAQPRGPSAGARSAAGTSAAAGLGAGTATSAAGTNPRSAPLLSRTSAGRSTSGKSAVTPWYLTWAGILALVIALLLALGLGVGLGVGLGTRNDGDGGKANAAEGNIASTITSMSTLSSIVTADPTSTTFVPILVTSSGAASLATVVQTVGGSTVTAVATAPNTASRAVITVSAAAVPSTRTEVVQVTTFVSTQTITTTLPGGAASTVTQVVTVRRTVTAQATGFARRAVAFGREEEA
ncbi:hypothetical protein JCM10450v2_000799 [Rhodotorula kratochvilovae]